MLILIILLLLSILVFQILKNKRHYGLTILLAILLVAFESLALLDSKYHYGTNISLLSWTKKVSPVIKAGSNGILIKREINEGKQKYNVYVYRDIKNNKKGYLYSKNQHINIRTNIDGTGIKTKRQIRKYNNFLAKIFFTGITTQGQTTNQLKTIELTKRNQILTTNQLKEAKVNMKKANFNGN